MMNYMDCTNNLDENSGVDDDTNFSQSLWCYIPDAVLLQIFSYLDHNTLLNAGLVCKAWNNLSYDDLLWRDIFHRDFKTNSALSCKPKTWLSEYRRLCYHIPIAQTETLAEHQHQVLHVSFSHNGKLFATCSKDGYILVWNSKYPVSLKYQRDMKTHSWKYTQYSQFNETDTLLLVSGVHFGTPHSTSGEIAVFSLEDGFELQCRVMNKPYDIFGTWYSDQYLLSGDLHWLAHLVSSSVLWLIKASQETASEHVPITSQLYRFYNRNASSIRAIMVANCLPDSEMVAEGDLNCYESAVMDCTDAEPVERGNPPSHRDINAAPAHRHRVQVDSAVTIRTQDTLDYARPFGYNCDYRKSETVYRLQSSALSCDSDTESSSPEEDVEELELEVDDSGTEKYLIFTTGSKTYTPHQIGFKRMRSINFPKRIDPGPSLKERVALLKEMQQRPDPDWLDFESVADKFDKVDHLIDLHGHIIGMALSPDHRYLYVNSRPWPRGYVIGNPLDPPPIAQEIDIHVIDLVTLKEVGTMLRAHKAYTPNNECFFIFLDVCHEYVASGAEDKHGYLWDRHYGVCLAKFPHSDVVNSVAFNPRDPEMLVTTSDDYTIKVWRSRAKLEQAGLDITRFTKAVEVRTLRNQTRRH